MATRRVKKTLIRHFGNSGKVGRVKMSNIEANTAWNTRKRNFSGSTSSNMPLIYPIFNNRRK